jgi:hypothetical protein
VIIQGISSISVSLVSSFPSCSVNTPTRGQAKEGREVDINFSSQSLTGILSLGYIKTVGTATFAILEYLVK